jgi:hypothetical protein
VAGETVGASPRWLLRSALVLLALAAALVLRAPRLFLELRLFADEATYFVYAYQHAWSEALVAPLLGYYSLVPSLGAVLGAHVLPLELAPLPMILLGVACLLTPAWLVMLPGSPVRGPWLQAAVAAAVLVVPPAQGRIDVVYAQYYLGLAAGVILVSSSPTRSTRRIRLAVLAVAGLTGGLAAALTPLFWLSAWWERSRERTLQAAVLTLGALVQALAVFSGEAGAGAPAFARWTAPELDVALVSIGLKSIGLPLLGRETAEALGARIERVFVGQPGSPAYWGTLLAAAVAAAGVLAAMLEGRLRRDRPLPAGWLLCAAYLCLVALGFAAGLTIGGNRLAYLTSHHRYFTAPNGFLILALAVQAPRPGRKALVCRLALVWMLCVGSFTFVARPHRAHLAGASWRHQVAAWRADPSHRIAVWPFWWATLELAPEPGAAAADPR